MEINAEQLAVIAEALGDAIAYRTDSGELADADLESDDAASVARFRALVDALGVEDQVN